MKNLLLIGDTDVLISTMNKDAHHARVKALSTQFARRNAQIFFPAAIVAETITTCQRKLQSPPLAEAMVKKLTSDLIETLATDDEILQLAASFFNPHGSKDNTFFDAIVVATAKKYTADAIFSFDEWYRKQGLTLAKDLITNGEQAA